MDSITQSILQQNETCKQRQEEAADKLVNMIIEIFTRLKYSTEILKDGKPRLVKTECLKPKLERTYFPNQFKADILRKRGT